VKDFAPAYLSLGPDELESRARSAEALARRCRLCPRECGVARLSGEEGSCQTAGRARVASYGPHWGEERVLVGGGGSGTIFFAGCNLACAYCQNFELSQLARGAEVSPGQLARMMLSLQERGCENINFVSPTHVVPAILEALAEAVSSGLRLPLVYNTGGYDALHTLKLLDGVVDIYMPDMKYSSAETGLRLSGVPDYPEVNRTAVKEMHRQVGNLQVKDGVARRGLLIRHLVLPGGLAGTAETARWIARAISPATAVNLMRQYYPCHTAGEHPLLGRRVTAHEWADAVQAVRDAGLTPLEET
jgi:putative pyruvate formate lyase activating enzyme